LAASKSLAIQIGAHSFSSLALRSVLPTLDVNTQPTKIHDFTSVAQGLSV